MRERHTIIWDGDCGFCQWSVQRLMRRDRHGRFDDVPRQRATQPPMTPELMERTSREVVVWTRDGELLGGADAVLFVLGETGWGFMARLLAKRPCIGLMRWGYRWVADHRLLISRLLRLPATCTISAAPRPKSSEAPGPPKA